MVHIDKRRPSSPLRLSFHPPPTIGRQKFNIDLLQGVSLFEKMNKSEEDIAMRSHEVVREEVGYREASLAFIHKCNRQISFLNPVDLEIRGHLADIAESRCQPNVRQTAGYTLNINWKSATATS